MVHLLYYIIIMADRKDFYGSVEIEGQWDSRKYKCCRLCKTTSKEGKWSHWSRGLCRSCYRRLSAKHRFYNDVWVDKNLLGYSSKDSHKKEYKSINPTDITFKDEDVESLLERYDYSCAYCKCKLQIHNTDLFNFMHIEYNIVDIPASYELVPLCKSCNCSKKNLTTPKELQRWAASKGFTYPFEYIRPKQCVQPK
jgi:hypothetical protein